MKFKFLHTPATLTVQSREAESKMASVPANVADGITPVSQLVAVPQLTLGATLAENVMVASPVPLVRVRVPDAEGAPVPVQNRVVAAVIVAVTVKVCPLFV